MIRSIQQIYGDKLGASDGEIGQIKDFYFDDRDWAIRYLVADTGSWLPGRLILIPPSAFGTLYQPGNLLLISLTRDQIENSPAIERHKPISRQWEEKYYEHHGWPVYWPTDVLGSMGGIPFPPLPAATLPGTFPARQSEKQEASESRLRSAVAITGYQIHTGSAIVGYVTDFTVDDTNWRIHRLVVNTGKRFSGVKVLLAPSEVVRISCEESMVYVNITGEAILGAPAYEEELAGVH